jgi:hypothetical protein
VSILRDFERRLEGLVEGFFAKTFRTGVQPVEFAKRLLREMESGHTVGVRQVWAPNHYVFRLSPQDHERLAGAEQALAGELRQVARDGAKERGWRLVGPPEISFETDERIGKGEFKCQASLVEGPDRPMTGEMERIAKEEPAETGVGGPSPRLHLIENGSPTQTFDLNKQIVRLGRMADCDVVIPDPGVSRHHAEIRRTEDGFVLHDLGSTNGTMVNEATIGERELEEGDRITIGHTVLEFRRR